MRKYQVTMYTFTEQKVINYTILTKTRLSQSRSQKSTYTNLTLKKFWRIMFLNRMKKWNKNDMEN